MVEMIRLGKKAFTVREWKKFSKPASAQMLGNSVQYLNHFTGEYESFDYVTVQEILIRRFDVILTDHQTKTEMAKSFLKSINMTNINKGIDTFNRGVQQFGGATDMLTREMGTDAKRARRNQLTADAKGRANLEALVGKKKKLAAPVKRRKSKKKKKARSNLDIIWGRK